MHRVVTKILLDTAPCDSRRHLDELRVPAVRNGYLLCETCLEGVETALIDLPDWYARCESAPDVDVHGCTPPVPGPREHSIRRRENVVQVKADIVGTLAAWCTLVAAQRGVRAPERPGVAPLTKFLAVHLQWLTARPGAVEFADDLDDLGMAVRNLLHPEPEPPASLGPCPWPGCGEQLYQTADESTGAAAEYLTCGAGHRWPPDEWPALGGERADTPKDDPDPADGAGQEPT